jgi:hypothetical protein
MSRDTYRRRASAARARHDTVYKARAREDQLRNKALVKWGRERVAEAARQIKEAATARHVEFMAAYNTWVAAGSVGEFVDPTDVAPPTPPEPPPGPFTKQLKEMIK